MQPSPFTPDFFDFFRDLAANNEREWFQANKDRYEEEVIEPSLRFVSEFGAALPDISPHFTAVPKRVGGSLFRIYRDTRFSKDKTPYKTFAGIRFPHRQQKDVHAPGFYLHLQPDECFIGMGAWHPASPVLLQFREAIVADPGGWTAVREDEELNRQLELGGDSLKRPPRGFDPEHPHVEDLKRKDFIAFTQVAEGEVCAAGFVERFAATCRAGMPLMRFLCRAVGAEA